MTNRKDWEISVSTCWSEAGPDLYRQLNAVDIHNIEFSGGHVDFFNERNFVQNSKAIVKEIADYGISVSSVHLPFSPFETMDPTVSDINMRNEIVRYQGDLLRASAEAGIPVAVIHPSGEPYGAFERGERMKCAAEFLHQIAEVADSCGIKLAIENLPRTCLCNIHEEMTLLLREVPSLYACFDTNHSLRQGNVEFIRAIGSKIITIHASDYDMIDERHLLPFLGRNNWHDIMYALEEVDYQGKFTFEVPCKDVLPVQALKLAYNKLMEI